MGLMYEVLYKPILQERQLSGVLLIHELVEVNGTNIPDSPPEVCETYIIQEL